MDEFNLNVGSKMKYIWCYLDNYHFLGPKGTILDVGSTIWCTVLNRKNIIHFRKMYGLLSMMRPIANIRMWIPIYLWHLDGFHFRLTCILSLVTYLLISCNDFIGVTLKERAPSSVGTLVDVGLNKVLLHSVKVCLA